MLLELEGRRRLRSRRAGGIRSYKRQTWRERPEWKSRRAIAGFQLVRRLSKCGYEGGVGVPKGLTDRLGRRVVVLHLFNHAFAVDLLRSGTLFEHLASQAPEGVFWQEYVQ